MKLMTAVCCTRAEQPWYNADTFNFASPAPACPPAGALQSLHSPPCAREGADG